MGCISSKEPIKTFESVTNTAQDSGQANSPVTGHFGPNITSTPVGRPAHKDASAKAAGAAVPAAAAEQKQPADQPASRPRLGDVSNADQPHKRSSTEKRKASASSLHSGPATSGRAFTKWAMQQAARTGQSLEEFVSANIGTDALADGSSCGASSSRGSRALGSAVGSSSGMCILVPFEPHDAAANGPPRPACDAERSAAAAGVASAYSMEAGELDAVLGAVCKALDMDSACITLHVGDTEITLASCGFMSPARTLASNGFCSWMLASSKHELLVVGDARRDARTADDAYVLDPDIHLTSYMGAPLISTDGHRIGTLCVMGQQPRIFDATRAQFLANMAELLVRQLERNWVMQLQAEQQRQAEQQQQRQEEQKGPRRSRALACYDSAYMLVDAKSWRVCYMNKAAEQQLGTNWRFGAGDLPTVVDGTSYPLNLEGVPLLSYLHLHSSCAKWQPFSRGFDVHGGATTQGREVMLHFRPAAGDGLDAWHSFCVGIPAWLPAARDSFGHNLFFVRIAEPDTALQNTTASYMSTAANDGSTIPAHHSSSSALAHSASYSGGSTSVSSSAVLAWWTRVLSASSASASLVPRGVSPTGCPVPGLVLGPLLGKGSNGRVYRGVYKGMPVAVKIIEDVSSLRTTATGELQEAVLTQGLHHTGIMRTVTYAYSADNGACWVLYEYCNLTCLQDAIMSGWFRTSKHITQGGADLVAVATTAYEIASAMAFLHKHDIVHGALKAGNVMLSTSTTNLHHFKAKVGDCCVARDTTFRPHCPKNAYDSIAHLPPEAFLAGSAGKPADVYAFGVLLWEMLTGARAWAGMRHAQIICQVALMKRQLAMPEGLPVELEKLLRSCLASQPARRCTCEEVVVVLGDYLRGGSINGPCNGVRYHVTGPGCFGVGSHMMGGDSSSSNACVSAVGSPYSGGVDTHASAAIGMHAIGGATGGHASGGMATHASAAMATNGFMNLSHTAGLRGDVGSAWSSRGLASYASSGHHSMALHKLSSRALRRGFHQAVCNGAGSGGSSAENSGGSNGWGSGGGSGGRSGVWVETISDRRSHEQSTGWFSRSQEQHQPRIEPHCCFSRN